MPRKLLRSDNIRLEAPGAGWHALAQRRAAGPDGWCEQGGVWLLEKPFAVNDLLAVMEQALL